MAGGSGWFVIVRSLFTLLLLVPWLGGQGSEKIPPKSVPEYSYKIVNSFPHDSGAYTQGLAHKDGFFYEGTGLNGRSSLRKVRINTGEVVQQADLPAEYFGEGIALLGDKIFQLTWKSETGFIYEQKSFRRLGEFSYRGEGWGLTTDGRDLYMSDGTAEIRVLDPGTFREKRRIKVHDGTTPVTELNELEFVGPEIFANVWQTDRIARISPQSGKVVGWIDLSGILSPVYRHSADAVLNGIAYDSKGKRLFVTGKLWPTVFEIQVIPKAH